MALPSSGSRRTRAYTSGEMPSLLAEPYRRAPSRTYPTGGKDEGGMVGSAGSSKGVHGPPSVNGTGRSWSTGRLSRTLRPLPAHARTLLAAQQFAELANFGDPPVVV